MPSRSRSPYRQLLEPYGSAGDLEDSTLDAPGVLDTLVTATPAHLRVTSSIEALWAPQVVPSHLAYTQTQSEEILSHGSIPVNCSLGSPASFSVDLVNSQAATQPAATQPAQISQRGNIDTHILDTNESSIEEMAGMESLQADLIAKFDKMMASMGMMQSSCNNNFSEVKTALASLGKASEHRDGFDRGSNRAKEAAT